MRAVERILMTADAVGGVWTYVLDLSRALGARGVQITLAVLGPPPGESQLADVRCLDHVTLRAHPGRLEWMDDPWADVDADGAWLRALEQETSPDVVHLNGYAHGALPWSAPVVVVGHSCVLSWWRAVHGEGAPASWQRYADAVTRGIRAADAVVAPSQAMLASLQAFYGPLPPSRVIANGRGPGADLQGRRKEPFILTAGRLWDAAKNVDAVCAVAARLPWPVAIAGDIHGPGNTVAECDSVQWLGRLDAAQMADCMGRASIYALPARYEPFGLSALEAAQAGCALVLGDIRSLREIWGEAALFVAPDNRAMLEATVRRLIDDEPLRDEMARRALARGAAFSAARMADGYCHVYSELMSEVRPLLSLSTV
jgi:glycosyltransferase involved in cell wall biosynthesis